MTKEKSKAPYVLGSEAFNSGCLVDDNPFNTQPEALQWECGFLEEESIWRLKHED